MQRSEKAPPMTDTREAVGREGDDLVARLRSYIGARVGTALSEEAFAEAADEIARLRESEGESRKANLGIVRKCSEVEQECAKLREALAVAERARDEAIRRGAPNRAVDAQFIVWRDRAEAAESRASAAEAEIERHIKAAETLRDKFEKVAQDADKALAELTRPINSIHAALNHDPGPGLDRARAALYRIREHMQEGR